MHILFAGGGTAGHINPALAVAQYIKNKHPDAKISYIGKKGGMEERLVSEAGFEFYPIDVAGFQRKISRENIARNFDALKKAVLGSARSKELLKKLKPDLVVGTGGYVSGPVLREASKLHIKTAIHEQNAFPGVTTKMLSNRVDLVMLAMKEAKNRMRLKTEPVVLGNPVRLEMLKHTKSSARKILNISDEVKVITSMGGSLGAGKINEAMIDIIAKHYKNSKFFFIHGAGKGNFDDVIKAANNKGIDLNSPNVIIKDYLDSTVCIPAADIVISRAGAISLTEIGVCGKPAIFIPSPNVAENHQYYNALSLKNIGAAELVEEKDIELLEPTLMKIINDDSLLKNMSAKAATATISNATEKIYSELMKLLAK